MQSFPYSLLIMWDISAFGAIFGLGIVAIYLNRSDRVTMFKVAFYGNGGALDDSNEGLSYRTAVLWYVHLLLCSDSSRLY